MDQMLPSPGFNIPSIGTPLHQPEEDQLILPNALQQQQQQPSTSQVPPLAPMGGLTPTLGLGMGHAMSMPQTKYVTGFALPISTITPQTPQHTMMSPMVNLGSTSGAGVTPNMGPSTPSPMTPMTPHSADPGIIPQLQTLSSKNIAFQKRRNAPKYSRHLIRENSKMLPLLRQVHFVNKLIVIDD
ncbi:hypothetical protein NQ317_016835 [Molorchus minor]|uniref:Uncharacterized protein n=1 Tax=Molorchus minor TaxID=1323400 RepID=A0ABQ9JMD9_9CUCU|nr:hypothetical protein NQ317_016835 [Molorchus minor]